MSKKEEINKVVESSVVQFLESTDRKILNQIGIAIGVAGLIYFSPRLLKGASNFILNYKQLKNTIQL
jgi:hypothetical protein